MISRGEYALETTRDDDGKDKVLSMLSSLDDHTFAKGGPDRVSGEPVDVTIIIVSWNSAHLLPICLRHVAAATAEMRAEVIVADNDSQDESVEICMDLPGVDVVIRLAKNVGFGRANNLAAQFARGRLLLLLNPDAFLEQSDAVIRLASRLHPGKPPHAVGPKLLNVDGSHQVGDGGWRPSIGHVAVHQLLLSRIFPRLRGLYIISNHRASPAPLEVDWLCGACLMVDRLAFLSVGGFPNDIFLYGEDVVLGDRLQVAGFQLVYDHTVSVLHLQGATQRDANASRYVSVRWIDALAEPYIGSGPLWDRFAGLCMLVVLGLGFAIRIVAFALLSKGGRDELHADGVRANWMYLRHLGKIFRRLFGTEK